MLVLTRKKGESIVIRMGGRTILEITASHIDRGVVRLGFTAEDDVRIDRKEVLELQQNIEIDPKFIPMRKSQDNRS